MENKLVMNEKCKERFAPVAKQIAEMLQSSKDPIIVALDGRCASGKTTLGYYLASLFDCNLFHMDDFFLQNSQRTLERLQEVGGNVDYERFLEEVLQPLTQKRDVLYRPFACSTREFLEGKTVPYKRLNLIEGSYSQHPYFGDVYSLKVFTDIDEKLQLQRIEARNGTEMLQKFITEWIPKEEAYFDGFHIREKSQMIL